MARSHEKYNNIVQFKTTMKSTEDRFWLGFLGLDFGEVQGCLVAEPSEFFLIWIP